VIRFLRSPRPAGSQEEPTRSPPWRRWALRALAAVAALVTLAVVAVVVLLHSLDRPWLKGRIQGLARSSAGVDIDYRTARVDLLSGAVIEDLVVQSPVELRGVAPELLRVGRVEADWSLGSLVLARAAGTRVRRVAISDVTLTVAVDENGRTSFDALSGPPSAQGAPPGPVVPLSRQAAQFLGTAPPLGRFDVDRVALALVETDHGSVSRRTELRGLAVTLATSSAAPAEKGWRVQAGLGSPAAPLELVLTRARAGDPGAGARAKLWLTVDATSASATAALDLRMIEQTFATSVSADHWLHADAGVEFNPAAGNTRVVLRRAEAGDGAATVEADVEIPDTGGPVVHRVHGDIDAARLLRWLPPGLLPVTAEQASVQFGVDDLALGPAPHLSPTGSVAARAELSKVVLEQPAASLTVGAAKLVVGAEPGEGGAVKAHASLELGPVRLAAGANRVAGEGVVVDVDGQQAPDGVLSGVAGVRFARVEASGAFQGLARDGRVEVRAKDLRPNADDAMATRGDVGLSIELASLEARTPAARAAVEGATIRAHTALEGHAPYAVELEATLSRLRAVDRDGGLLADAPAHLDAWARDVEPDLARPAASRGAVHVAVDLGDVHASLDSTKKTDDADFTVAVDARSLAALRPVLPPPLPDQAPWERMAVRLRSTGRVEHLRGNLAVAQTAEVAIDNPAFEKVAAKSVSLKLASQGTLLQHHADLDLHAWGLALDGGAPRDDRLTLSATVDRTKPSLQLQLATEGRAATTLAASVSFDPARRAVPYSIEGHLGGLAPLAPLAATVRGLDAFDLSELDVALSAHGSLLGVVAGVAQDGTVALEPDPARTAAVEGQTDLRVAHFRWSKGDTAILTPALAWHADMHVAGARRTMESHVEVGTLHLDLGSKDVDLNGIGDSASVAVTGSLANPELEVTQKLAIRAVEQDLVPEYPLGDLAFAVTAERGHEGVIHISDLKFANGLGGTTLAVGGNVDLSEGRRTLSVTTSLTQQLERLSKIPERFQGRGNVAVEASVNSPDLLHFQVRAAVKGQEVTVSLPRTGVEIDTANGEVPITVALETGSAGVALQRTEKRSPYSMLRFADQHPLLTRSGFLSIARIKTPFVSIAPLVGNLEIDQNVVSLRQFEMGVRGGRITGQCGIDWDGPRSTLELHVRATGVQSSHGEPFDGNIAVAISAADRSIDGRAEILRIGEQHLLDLLDLQDPQHVDKSMNLVRTALNFGYPDKIRLVFDHGFASVHIELGGIAHYLFSLSDLNLPMGKMLDQMLSPVLEGPATKETP
jgi:hypothetical protein